MVPAFEPSRSTQATSARPERDRCQTTLPAGEHGQPRRASLVSRARGSATAASHTEQARRGIRPAQKATYGCLHARVANPKSENRCDCAGASSRVGRLAQASGPTGQPQQARRPRGPAAAKDGRSRIPARVRGRLPVWRCVSRTEHPFAQGCARSPNRKTGRTRPIPTNRCGRRRLPVARADLPYVFRGDGSSVQAVRAECAVSLKRLARLGRSVGSGVDDPVERGAPRTRGC